MRRYLVTAFLLYSLAACNGNDSGKDDATTDNSNPAPPAISYNVLKVYPHDTSSYTEGLVYYNNALYESGGEYGQSKLYKANIETGKAEKEIKIDSAIFGEGISIIDNKLYQLTYREHKVFVYDLNTFKKIKEMEWPYEGWGMTTNGKQLIISTGGSNLYFVNPDDFKIIKSVGVTDNYGPVGNVNELEFVNNIIYANVYQSDYIIKIDPETGKVLGKIDLTGILAKSGQQNDNAEVLNGIAYDSAKNSLYITGKYWSALFEIKLN